MYFYNDLKVGIDIRDAKNLLDSELQLLELSLLQQYAPIEIWSAIGTNQQMAYSTHGAFRYFGKFPPPIATYLIQQYTNENDLVFDPMCGSGTTGVESLLQNRKAILNDVSPLSILLSKVKTTYLEKDMLEKTATVIYQRYRPLSFEEYSFEPNCLRNYDHWFLPETIDSLRGIKFLIEKIENDTVKDFFQICFASTIRRVSKATTQQGRLFLDIATSEKDALPFFKKRVSTAIDGVSSLPQVKDSISYTSFDLRECLPNNLKNTADLIICHPPYFNSYKYSSINSLELAWLDFDYSSVRKKEVREYFKVGKEDNVINYVSDMTKVLDTLHDALKPESRLCLMIGDTIMHDKYIPVTKMLLDSVSSQYIVEKIVLRAPKYTEAAWVASQRRTSSKVGISLYDFIVILRRQ